MPLPVILFHSSAESQPGTPLLPSAVCSPLHGADWTICAVLASLLGPGNSLFLCFSEGLLQGGKGFLTARCPELKLIFPLLSAFFVFPKQPGSGSPLGATSWAHVSAGSFLLCRSQGVLRDVLNACRPVLYNILY